MANWVAVLPDGRIQDPYLSPLHNPEPGFIVGVKAWAPYGYSPITFEYNRSVFSSGVFGRLLIACINKEGVKYVPANERNLGLDPLNPNPSSRIYDLVVLSDDRYSSTSTIYRSPHGADPWLDIQGGEELILYLELRGYDNGAIETLYTEPFWFFTGDRQRSQVFFTDRFESSWESTNPGHDYHTTPQAGCERFAYRHLGSDVYSLRIEQLWSGDYIGLKDLVISGIHIGEFQPEEGAISSSSGGPAEGPYPLIHVLGCTGVNLEITRMVLIGGYPPIYLDNNTGDDKNTAKIFNNVIIKDVLKGSESPIIPPQGPYFWDMWMPFDNSNNENDYPPIDF